MELERHILESVVAQALKEDVGPGDVTAESVLPEQTTARAVIISRASGVIAGLPVAGEAFRQVSSDVTFQPLVEDGSNVAVNARVAQIRGPARAVVTAERVALNFLQRLSGIATFTRRCAEAVAQCPVTILDTRKTTPGLRHLEKYAVRLGGGKNHRLGLYDQVLIKDNHLRLIAPDVGGLHAAVRLAVQRARSKLGDDMVIEVEVESLPMLDAAIAARADIIMLDNMTIEEMREATARVRSHRGERGERQPLTEASGKMTLERLAAVAESGVDAISIGALTHSAPVLDMAMDIV